MDSPAMNIIMASDFGGTKGDVLIVNADDGSIVRHVFETWRTLPFEILSQIKEARGGIGRSREMIEYCQKKAIDGLNTNSIYFISNGFGFYFTVFESLGLKCEKRLSMWEAEGVMYAEGFKTGICSLLGTGATSEVFIEGELVFLIDSFGLVGGDWGGADYIGFNFIRNLLREQMFQNEIMPETNDTVQFIEQNVKDIQPFDHSKPQTSERTTRWIVTVIAGHGNNVSLVASFAQLCDSCANKGSAIAKGVLEMAGREIAENIRRAAVFKGIDKLERLPVVAGGSVFIHSDFVFDSFRKNLAECLPNASIIRSRKTQTYGQVIKMLESIHTPEKAAKCIARFKSEADGMFSVNLCN